MMKKATNPVPVETQTFLSLDKDDFCDTPPVLPSTNVVVAEEDKRMRFLHKRIRRIVAAINTIIKISMTDTATMMKYSKRN